MEGWEGGRHGGARRAGQSGDGSAATGERMRQFGWHGWRELDRQVDQNPDLAGK